MITVKSDVQVYSVNAKSQSFSTLSPKIEVHSDPFNDGMVVLCLWPHGDNPQYLTVSAKDLKAAIENATNTAKW